MDQQFRNAVYLSDTSGTGAWRKIWPINSINCLRQQLNVQADYSQTPIIDQNYYKGMTTVTVQRWISDQQENLFCKFLKPLMDANNGWLIYEIDDLMTDGTIVCKKNESLIREKYKDMSQISIPKFNRGRKAFEGEKVQTSIMNMLNAADFVTVTTDKIKEVYHDLYGIPYENILAVPNLLPRYLFGDRYDPDKKIKQFQNFKKKPRIGIVSSLSHYNIDNVRQDKNGLACRKQKLQDGREIWQNELGIEVQESETNPILDDFDQICDCVRSTVDIVQWVMFGYCPPKIKDLADAHKIEVHGGVPIMNYASRFDNLQLQAVVAAINPMEFNYCKSFIKTMECAALGVPLFATNCLPYNRVMDSRQLFNDGNDLKAKILKLKDCSNKIYLDIIERQWKWLNSPCHEGDFDLKNFWLEDNLNIHADMFRLRSKTLQLSYAKYAEQRKKKEEQEKSNTIYRNKNIQILK